MDVCASTAGDNQMGQDLFVDEEALLNKPKLIAEMAVGLLMSPPWFGPVVSVESPKISDTLWENDTRIPHQMPGFRLDCCGFGSSQVFAPALIKIVRPRQKMSVIQLVVTKLTRFVSKPRLRTHQDFKKPCDVHGQQSGIVGSPIRPERTQGFINIPFPNLNLAGVDVAHNSVSGIYEHQYGVESPHRQELLQNIENGQKLTVEVKKISPEDEFDSFEICSTTGIESTPRLGEVRGEGMMQLDFSSQQVDAANGSMKGIHEQQNGSVGSTPRLAKAQGGEGMTQVDFSPQQVDTTSAYMNGVHGQQGGISGSPPRTEHTQELTVGVDVVHNSLNGIYEQNNGIVESPHRQELPRNIENIAHGEPIMEIDVANPERGGAGIEQNGNKVINTKKHKSNYTLKSELGITLEVLEQNSWRNLEDAAKVLGVSRSTLKRRCRKYDIDRWPPRKARKVNQEFVEQTVVQPSTENIEERHRPDTARLKDDSNICVKAEYQGSTMKFRLPLSASKFNLEEQVAQRLNRPIGNFKIEYKDEENEWIWIACDEDLRTCISTLSSLDRTTIRMLVR